MIRSVNEATILTINSKTFQNYLNTQELIAIMEKNGTEIIENLLGILMKKCRVPIRERTINILQKINDISEDMLSKKVIYLMINKNSISVFNLLRNDVLSLLSEKCEKYLWNHPKFRSHFTKEGRHLKFAEESGEIYFRKITKYDIKKYIVDSDSRTIKVEIPLSDIEEILKHDYNYNLNVLKWRILYFTSQFISKHIMGINGIGIGNDILSFHNPNSFCLNGNGYNFLNEVFFIEKFQKIGNYDGRSRVTQLYNDLSVWISKNRWVDVAINMGAIIEYCIDNYVEIKSLKEFFKKGKLIDNFNQKLNIILQNPTSNPGDIFN